MDDVRDYIILGYSKTTKTLHMSGVHFAEFLRSTAPSNLIVTQHEGSFGTRDEELGITYVDVNEIKTIAENAGEYGDLECFDVPSLGDFQAKVAEHEDLLRSVKDRTLSQPSALLDRFGSHFFYVSHDDGWYTRLYLRDACLTSLTFALAEAKLWSLIRFRGSGQPDEIPLEAKLLSGSFLFLAFPNLSRVEDRVTVPCFDLGPLLGSGQNALDVDSILGELDALPQVKVGDLSFGRGAPYADDALKIELLELAARYEPHLVEILIRAFEAGATVRRYKSGKKAGALYVSLVPSRAESPAPWSWRNPGRTRAAYERLQEISRTISSARRDAASKS